MMKGQINTINPQTNEGTILGEDGRQYPFNLSVNSLGMMTKSGDTVEFAVDDYGVASQIQTALNPYQAPAASLLRTGSTDPSINPDWEVEENYGIVDWVKKCFRNYANFGGRARRKEYWFFSLGIFVLSIIGSIIDAILRTKGIIGGLLGLAVIVPSIAVSVRRLHDIGKSGWWWLISFIPLIGSIILLVWLATDTKPETNQWGLPARRV